jgi:hypothetical protein
MTKQELQRMRAWADGKIVAGNDPPWAFFQYMKLRETLDTMLESIEPTYFVTLPEDLPHAGSSRGAGHLRVVDN